MVAPEPADDGVLLVAQAETSVLTERSLQIRQGLHFAEIQDEGVLLDLIQDRYLGLYSLGAAIWRALSEGRSREQAVRTLVGEHELSPLQAGRALDVELSSWTESGLLVPAGPREPGDGHPVAQPKPVGAPTSRMIDVDGVGRFGLGAVFRLLRARLWAGRRVGRQRPDRLLAELASGAGFEASMSVGSRRTIAAYRWARKLLSRQDDCLLRTVTVARALQLQGIPCDICFGVRKVPFLAHSWVEVGGESVDPPQALARLTVVARF